MSLDIEKLQGLCKTARLYLGSTAIIAGGAVRDTLHGREVKDIDIFVNVRPGDVDAENCARRDTKFARSCELLAAHWRAHPGGEKIAATMSCCEANKSGGELADLCNIVGAPYPVQVIGIFEDPVDDVQNYDFALSQCFVTPSGLFYTERYLGDANGLTVSYVGTSDTASARFYRSLARWKRLRAKYEPEFKFLNCGVLEKAERAQRIEIGANP